MMGEHVKWPCGRRKHDKCNETENDQRANHVMQN